jgi:sugar/nucleoside kinase (ribokinase family)
VNEILLTLGDLIEDVRVRPSGPIRPGTDTPSTIERRLGGSAALVALAAARDGTKSAFVGNVGRDAAGDRLLDDLAAAGVVAHVSRSGRTGTVVALLADDGDRTMLTDRASSGDFSGFEPAWLREIAILHVPAYSLLGGSLARAAEAAIPRVRRERGLISVDVSSVGAITDFGTTDFLQLIGHLGPDVLLANKDEAALLSTEADLGGLGGIVVVKQGAEPALVWRGTDLTEVPVPDPARVTDSTGAGDAFAAGFLGGLMRGVGPGAAAERGHAVAARTIRQQ